MVNWHKPLAFWHIVWTLVVRDLRAMRRGSGPWDPGFGDSYTLLIHFPWIRFGFGSDRIGSAWDRIRMWIGFDRIGSDRIGLDRNGSDWIGSDLNRSYGNGSDHIGTVVGS